MKENCISQFLLDLLTCPKGCDRGLQISMEYDSVEHGELLCPSCNTAYPVISGVPVLFPDKERRDFTVDKSLRLDVISKIRELEPKIRYDNREKYLGVVSPKELESLAWEYLFWQKWESEYGAVSYDYDKEKFEMILENDSQGGGRIRFFNLVKQREVTVEERIILNAGSGRDLLYRKFTDNGAYVIEQDIVLDSLLALRDIGASGICCDLRSLPVRDGAIDIVTSFQTLHHIHPIEIPVQEMSRVLRGGGGLYINEPNAWELPVLARQIMDTLPGRIRAAIVRKVINLVMSSSPYEKSIKARQLLQILNEAKAFSKIEITHIHQKKKNIQPALRAVDSMIVGMIPVLSSHIEVYARKSNSDIEGH